MAYWGEISNRRKFFEHYAKQHGFDHKIPENWYTHPKKLIYTAKVIDMLLLLSILNNLI